MSRRFQNNSDSNQNYQQNSNYSQQRNSTVDGSYTNSSVNNGGDNRGRKRSHSRERSRSRSDSRERKRKDRNYNGPNNNYDQEGRDRGNRSGNTGGNGGSWDRNNNNNNNNRDFQSYNNNFNNNNNNFQARSPGEPAVSIVIKGLPNHTVESTLYAVLAPYYVKDIRLITQRDGECKGYAFVEFISLEYSQYFMTSFAGSAGDPNAPQLIIENRAVQLEYARDMSDKKKDFNNGFRKNDRAGGGGKDDPRGLKSDWLCEACGCHNFARRDICFRCNLARTENAIAVAQNGEPFGDSMVAGDTPCCFLVVRGFAPFVTEQQLMELFRQFAVVKSTHIIRDPQNRSSRGFAYIEFQSVEHAAYALQCSADLKLNSTELKVAYARENIMQQMLVQAQNVQSMNIPTRFTPNAGLQNALVAQAMQAAQWSMNNGYSAAGAAMGLLPSAPPMLPLGNAVQGLPLPANSTAGIPGAPTNKPLLLWPPNFDTHGGSYVFQQKTGYFLEPNSHYYYCPKSKLYYNALEGTYYHYDASLDPPFKRYDPPLPTEPENPPSAAENAATSEATNVNRPLVSISLNKVKGKPTVAPTTKKVLKDLAKWEAIQKEDEEEEQETSNNTNSVFVKRTEPSKAITTASTTKVSSGTVASSSINATSKPSDDQLTNAVDTGGSSNAASLSNTTSGGGQPICLLCRRQFPSMEMLARHEKESKLHAENLAKQKQQQTPQYRDRAEERREKFGSVPDHIPKSTAPDPIAPIAVLPAASAALLLPPAPPKKAPVAVSEDLSNPGNQMLRKMGWKEGQGLGKDGEGKEIALGVELASNQQNNSNSMHATLKSTTGNGGTGPNSNYKDHVYNAARSRYDQLYKNEK